MKMTLPACLQKEGHYLQFSCNFVKSSAGDCHLWGQGNGCEGNPDPEHRTAAHGNEEVRKNGTTTWLRWSRFLRGSGGTLLVQAECVQGQGAVSHGPDLAEQACGPVTGHWPMDRTCSILGAGPF